MILDLSGVRALVTGGTRGIGRAITETLCASGVRVAANYRSNTEAAEEFGRSLGERRYEHMLLKTDVTQERAVGTMVRRIEESWGGLDLLVLNAGIWEAATLGSMTIADWRDTINTNLTGAFITANEAIHLMRRGLDPEDLSSSPPKRIVFVSSAAGVRGEAHHSHYAASKGGMLAMARSLARELAPEGFTVNAVAPGWIDTEMSRSTLEDSTTLERVTTVIPLGRVGNPEEVAAAVVFLASRQASFITGQTLNVNGGEVM